MQKKLLAAAVAGALAVPTTLASAAGAGTGSTVQIYGQAEWEHGYMDQGSGRPKVDYQETTGSYLGFRGTESLGGGLAAWFQCETTMDIRAIDQVGLCSRNSGLGFRGGFGNFWVGRWHTPMSRAMALGSIGTEETGILGMSGLVSGGTGSASIGDAAGPGGDLYETQSLLRRRFRRREACLTTYESPRFGGFMLGAAVSCGNHAAESGATNQANDKPRVWSFAGTYVSGPLSVGLAYERHNEMGAWAANAPELDDRAWGISAAYTFGPVRLGVMYMDRKWEQTDGDLKKKAASIGAEWQIAGPHSLEVAYAWQDDTEGSSAIGIEATAVGGITAGNTVVGGVRQSVSDTGAQSFSIAYQYNFSKRTTAKFGYVRQDNDSNSQGARLFPAASVRNPGDAQDAFALVVKHRF